MSDIDFDELDRAVASVLNTPAGAKPAEQTVVAVQSQPTVTAPVAPAPAPAVTTPSVSESEPVTVRTSMPQPVVAQPYTAPEQPKPAAVSAQDLHPIAQKPVQRGRFLDMVHPAHDMAARPAPASIPVTPSPAPAVSPSTNQTFVSDVVAPTPTPAAQTVEPVVSPVAAPEVVPSEPEAPAEPEPTTPQPAEASDFFANNPSGDDQSKAADTTPSPFIPDAKVEKRPLGAFSVGENGLAPSSLPFGDELHEKLVQVESEDNIIATAESPIPEKTDTSFFGKKAGAKEATESVAVPAVTSPSSAPAATQDEKEVKPHHGLFDHATHDKAPKKRVEKAPKHGKGTLIWVTVAIAVMLIGFGVGATLYFVVLQ